MKQTDTKQKIILKALELFSDRGYDAVSVGEIASAVGIRASSLYNHFPSKRAIFDAIVEATAAQYESISTCKMRVRILRFLHTLPRMRCLPRCARFSNIPCTTNRFAAFAG